MIDAVKAEIDELKKIKNEIVLFEGVLIKQIDSGFVYRFEIPEGTYLRVVEEVEIYIGREEEDKAKGELVSVENQFATIKLTENLGKIIPHLTVVWHSDMILRKLSERMFTVMNESKKFCISTTEQLFYPTSTSNTVSWNKPLILPSKTYITDPPKEFYVNQRQKEALKKALENKVTFIWGPPGTGKTQALGMIAYNLIKGGRKVLLASNTNRAVDNGILSVIDRYKEHGGDFVRDLTRYGQIALINVQDLQLVSFEHQTEALRKEKRKRVKEKIELLKSYKEAKRNLAVFDEQIKRIDELDHNLAQEKIELDAILRQLKILQTQIENFDKGGVIIALKRKFTGVTKEELENKFANLQERGRKTNLTIERIQQEKEYLKKNSTVFSKIRNQFEELKKHVDALGGETDLSEEIERELQIDVGALLREKTLIATTLAKIVMNEVFWHLRYDVLLIDEASMVCLPYLATLSALSNEKVIIVGDSQQLPPISLSEDTECKRWLQRDIYMFAGQCTSTEELFRWNAQNPEFTVFLNTQYRMASDLCSVISDFFYEGKLINGLSIEKSRGQIVFIDSSPLHPVIKKLKARRFKPYNETHTKKIVELIKTSISINHYQACQIGIIVPFNGSVQYIREQLRLQKLKNIEVGTVHTFQGREKPVIIFDTVMAGVGYTVRPFDEVKTSDDKVCRLLNVALSRAQRDIFIIADMNHFRSLYSRRIIYKLLEKLNHHSTEIELDNGLSTFEEMDEEEKNRLLGFDD